MNPAEARIEEIIRVLNGVADEQFVPFSPERASDSLGRLEQVVERLQEKVKTASAESGRTMNSIVTSSIRMFLWSEALQKINNADNVLYHDGDIENFYHQIVREAQELLRARYAMLVLFDEAGKPIKFITEGISAEEIARIGHYPEGKGLLAAFYHEHDAVKVDDIALDPRSCGFPPNHPPMKSLLGAPLEVAGKTRGVLYFTCKEFGEFFEGDQERLTDHFSDSDRVLLGLFADYLARVLERLELMATLRDKNALLQQEKSEQQTLLGQLHEAQNQLLQSEKMASIGQLAAGVAHEINNPIGYINSNLSMLQQYIKDLFGLLSVLDEADAAIDPAGDIHQRIEAVRKRIDIDYLRTDIVELMKESLEGVERVKKIVQDLKDFSHVDEAEWQCADLHKGLESTLNVVWNELKYKVEVIRQYGEIPEVKCLPFQINQVFMNMLVNAAHAIDKHGTLIIATGTAGDEVWISFSDNGSGISPENLTHIFEPFFTTKPVGKGTGLGLSLSYSIVQKHGGRIEVTSELGKGTTFKIFLPIRQSETH